MLRNQVVRRLPLLVFAISLAGNALHAQSAPAASLDKPVALIHGIWSDGSTWNIVWESLRRVFLMNWPRGMRWAKTRT